MERQYTMLNVTVMLPRMFDAAKRFARTRRVAAVVSGTVLATALFCPCSGVGAPLTLNAGSKALPLELKQTLPDVPLRGFGTVAGKYWTAGGGGAVLEIGCESEDKARLTLAKYLSDLHVLPGVETTPMDVRLGKWALRATTVSVHLVQGQGIIAAVRSAKTVFIVAAPDQEGLKKLLERAFTGSGKSAISTAETTVPMWLDRFDKYGFRFYYAPFTRPAPNEMPKDEKPATYDFTRDFDFARQTGAGLVMWSTLSHQAWSEGVTNANWWGWVENWARPYGLPVGVNLSAYNYDISNWVANRYRSELAQPMPHYLGDSMSIAGWRGTGGKVGELAWGATEARDAMFGSLQLVVRRFAQEPIITSWLEPHGEFYQGGDAFMGYGPAVDATFRDYLKNKYGTIAALNAGWGDKLAAFAAVKAPELAEFAGWNADALDLAGAWRVGYPKGNPADDWFTETFDDQAWTAVTAPGDDHNFFLPKQAAVYRRTVEVSADRFKTGDRSWIYLWDLNVAWDKPVQIWLNGQKIGDSLCRHPSAHWMVAEATAALRPGRNQLSLNLPSGYIGYRIYLSRTEPKQYPALGQGLNAKWADFVDWRETARMASARRGVEMIREVDPNRQIDFMAPHASCDGLKGMAENYGGNFKDTGFMGGVWAELLPSLMRGSNMPFSLEPGGPPDTVPQLRRMMGLYHSEAIQAVDYFIHIGCVEWRPDIRNVFEETLPLWHLFGKYHTQPADLAILWDFRMGALTGFPWGGDLNTNTLSGWSCRQVPESLLQFYPRDGITEGDFARGNAARYKVIIDTNSSIVTDAMLGQIENYVRNGGIFVTLGQTGRHTPTTPNSWPISRLTGYEVLTIEKFDAQGHTIGRFKTDDPNPGSPCQPVMPAAGQKIYPQPEEWMNSPYLTGLRLKKVAGDAQDLLLWKDGAVAAGMRKLGKGHIVQFGCKSDGGGVSIAPSAWFSLLDWAGVRRNLATLELARKAESSTNYYFREYASNNGLYDIWSLWNENDKKELQADIVLKTAKPTHALDIVTGKDIAIRNGRLSGFTLAPLETRMFLTPRTQIGQAALDWFVLQRGWWRGTTPVTKGFPAPSEKYRRSLNAGWAWLATGDKDLAESWAAPSFDDSAWKRQPLGIWSTPENLGVRKAAMRKTFTVPNEWDNGRVALWVRSTGYPDFAGVGRIWLDGKMIQNWGGEAADRICEDVLKAGTTHTVMLEVKSEGPITGLPGDCWLTYAPNPATTIDLAGTWKMGKDMFKIDGDVTLPGNYAAKLMRRSVVVSRELEGKTAVLTMRSQRAFSVFVNGTYLPFSGGPTKNGNIMNITPFLRYGQDNAIELVSVYDKGEVKQVSLDFYDKSAGYP